MCASMMLTAGTNTSCLALTDQDSNEDCHQIGGADQGRGGTICPKLVPVTPAPVNITMTTTQLYYIATCVSFSCGNSSSESTCESEELDSGPLGFESPGEPPGIE